MPTKSLMTMRGRHLKHVPTGANQCQTVSNERPLKSQTNYLYKVPKVQSSTLSTIGMHALIYQRRSKPVPKRAKQSHYSQDTTNMPYYLSEHMVSIQQGIFTIPRSIS